MGLIISKKRTDAQGLVSSGYFMHRDLPIQKKIATMEK
jgi:hypothetical protein